MIVPGLAGVDTIFLALAGGGLAAVLVFGIARLARGGVSPVRLTLAGITISLLAVALLQGILIVFSQDSELFFFWLVGGVTYANWHDVHTAYPWLLAGFVLAILLAKSLNGLALGDDVARGLGYHVGRARFLSGLCIVLLACAAVGVVGPIAFIGLIAPHIVKRATGSNNHFVVLPLSMMAGAALLLYADIAARHLDTHVEMPAGIVVAPLGALLFIYLARREKLAM